ncbi:MAG: hypothetical protein JSU70_02630 [Phycisphaerales bacterium]|nr:MAG: hypothetical protein JSU70_02630 [Phycisphaerales bacterium]
MFAVNHIYSFNSRLRVGRCPFETRLALCWVLAAVALGTLLSGEANASAVIDWDFRTGVCGWVGNGRVEGLVSSAEGLVVRSTGQDPWIEGPAVDLPPDKTIRVNVRMKSSADASGELFYGRTFRAGHSAPFYVRNDGRWHDYHLVIDEPLGSGTRLRLDPCAGEGEVTVAFIRVDAISKVTVPSLEKPEGLRKTTGGRQQVSRSGGLELVHRGGWGNFVVRVDGTEMATGYHNELIGLLLGDEAEWLNLKRATITRLPKRSAIACEGVVKDSRGGLWHIQRHVLPGKRPGTLTVTTSVAVDRDRDVIHMPWLTLFPGLGTFGERKYQGLFAGVEYLCDEPSSSKADIVTSEYLRRVPDPVKITFPLMAIGHAGRYIGVIWDPSEMVAASFDSPDRLYNSGAHVMSLSAPAVGELRFENDFCAHTPFRLRANKPLTATALIIGGTGKTVVPAVRHYVDIRDVPAVPLFEGGSDGAVKLLAHGWLDSQINENWRFRHAVWGDSFGPAPAADAAMFIDWLANNTADRGLAERLSGGRDRALERIPPGQPFSSGVSHVRPPTAPLVFGRLREYVLSRRNQARHLLGSFSESGIKLYGVGKTDYSTTHFAKHANGLSGRDVVSILEAAVLSADRQLIEDALELLDKQTRLYADTVPRGAQTWEVPLHTPDILASAHMVKAYTLGYVLSGREEHLQQARYWAWTGVPFVYLHPPTPGRVGPYATIAVLGATNWKAPVWFGRPVQWCGLVYGSALHMLSDHDPAGPWAKIAKGITAAGLQMSWPLADEKRLGLLPDFFDLRTQVGAGPAINPGTVQAHVPELYGLGKVYHLRKISGKNWLIHAPCAISDINEGEDCLAFTTDGWGDKSYSVLASGVDSEPGEVQASKLVEYTDKSPAFEPAQAELHKEAGILVIALRGKSRIRIRY